MKFASTRLIAADMLAMVAFYENITGQKADWLAPVFAELIVPPGVLAIGAEETVALFEPGSAKPAANQTAILEFQVADVDAEYERLKDQVDWVHGPKVLPWGNRTVQFRDPEGNLVALFMPQTEAAKQRFGQR